MNCTHGPWKKGFLVSFLPLSGQDDQGKKWFLVLLLANILWERRNSWSSTWPRNWEREETWSPLGQDTQRGGFLVSFWPGCSKKCPDYKIEKEFLVTFWPRYSEREGIFCPPPGRGTEREKEFLVLSWPRYSESEGIIGPLPGQCTEREKKFLVPSWPRYWEREGILGPFLAKILRERRNYLSPS